MFAKWHKIETTTLDYYNRNSWVIPCAQPLPVMLSDSEGHVTHFKPIYAPFIEALSSASIRPSVSYRIGPRRLTTKEVGNRDRRPYRL